MVTRTAPRVALVTSHPLSRPWDSADKHVAALVNRRLSGYRFVSARRLGHHDDLPGMRVPVLSRDGRPGAVEAAQIAGIAAGASPFVELLHAVVTIGPGFPRLSRVVASLPSGLLPPILHTVPGIAEVGEGSRRVTGMRALGTTVVWSEHSATVLRNVGFPDVRVVPPGTNLDRWRVFPRPSGDPLVLFAGHHDDCGGAVAAVEAFAKSSWRDSARLVLAMRARIGQSEEDRNEALLAYARSLGLGRVSVLGHVDDMAGLIRSASVLVLPAARLAGKADVPLVALEAMATGRPAVLSDLPSMAALRPGAILLPVEPDAFAAAIDALLDDRDAWYRQAARGRLMVQTRFDERSEARAYDALYTELIGDGRLWRRS